MGFQTFPKHLSVTALTLSAPVTYYGRVFDSQEAAIRKAWSLMVECDVGRFYCLIFNVCCVLVFPHQ